MQLESRRLYLYPISDEDMAVLIRNEKDAEMKQAYSEMLQGCLNEPEKRIWYAIWLMELKSCTGMIVGDFSFKGIDPDGMVEIGYGLREGFCGNGYMTEAIKLISEWALMQPGIMRVEAETDPENTASRKVLVACGFHPTGSFGAEGPRFELRRTGQ